MFGMKVVVRPIKIGRHDCDEVGSVLLAVNLAGLDFAIFATA